jgi:hypothetical protein
MEDRQIWERIKILVDEEHELRRKAQGTLRRSQEQRLRVIDAALDQCWDLVRQLRAGKESGLVVELLESRREPLRSVGGAAVSRALHRG